MDLSLFKYFDSWIFSNINQISNINPQFDHLVSFIADANFLNGGCFFLILCWLWFSDKYDRDDSRRETLRAFAGAVASFLAARLLQIFLPGRVRPLHNALLHFTPPAGSDVGALEHWSSFPSDHAAIYAALSYASFRLSRPFGILVWVWTLTFGCLTRIYVGYHYPSDVLGGTILGIAVMSFIYSLPRTKIEDYALRKADDTAARYPQVFYVVFVLIIFQFATMLEEPRELLHLTFDSLRH